MWHSDRLGYADAIRFPVQIGPGQGDYLEWQDRIFGDMGVGELYEEAQRHRQRRKKQKRLAANLRGRK